MGGATKISRRAAALVAAVAAVALSATAAPAAASSDATITVYNAQHVALTQAWADDFTKKTGIKVQMRNGRDYELANQLVAEGSASPADVFLTENSPGMTTVSNEKLFAKVSPETLANVPAQYSPSGGEWVGIAARTTVLAYNPTKIADADLPKSIMDLADPKWKDRVGIASSGADFQAIVSAVLDQKAMGPTLNWLRGLKANAKVYSGNGTVMRAVNAGDIPVGVIYHYYWFQDQAEAGANSSNVKLLYFTGKDPGAFVSVSGGGVLKSSQHKREAQAFLAYVTGKQGQTLLGTSNAMEYPVGSKVAANARLKPLAQLDPPKIDVSTLNGPKTLYLLQQVGLL
jgi:iron(III) transport system substrate-binding protein